MSGCNDGCQAPTPVTARLRRVLYVVLVLNLIMFVAEFGGGIWAQSSALLADSLDMLGDVLVYAISLFVLTRSLRARAGAALCKGLIQLVFGLAVLGEVGWKLVHGAEPVAGLMLGFGAAALAVNLLCMLLLLRYREHDLNMESVWLCSRNDVLGNLGVLVAAGLVFASGGMWPDVLVGLLIAAVFLHTSVYVIRASLRQLRRPITDPESRDTGETAGKASPCDRA